VHAAVRLAQRGGPLGHPRFAIRSARQGARYAADADVRRDAIDRLN
jgi:hypothetical protein